MDRKKETKVERDRAGKSSLEVYSFRLERHERDKRQPRDKDRENDKERSFGVGICLRRDNGRDQMSVGVLGRACVQGTCVYLLNCCHRFLISSYFNLDC